MESQNELTYLIKYANDKASYNARLKDIDKLEQQRADKDRPKSSKATKERLDDIKKEKSALKELRKTLRQYREDLATVQKTVRETGQATEGNIAVQKSLGEAIGETRKQIEQATRGSLDYDTILQQQPTTYNELVQQNRALSLAMRDIPLEDTSGRLQELQARYKENNDALKAFDAELGNHQRNVGNYQGSLEGVITSLRGGANAIAIFQGPLGPLAGRINSLATTLSRLSQTQTANSAGAATLGRILAGNIPLITTTAGAMTAKGRAVNVANTAIRGLNISLKATRVAFMALGIPAILIALGSLASFFTRTEEGQQKLRVITAGLSAAFAVFTDRASALGKAIFEAVQNPRQALENFRVRIANLGATLLGEVIERFMGMRTLVEGVVQNLAGRFSILSARIKLIVADTPLIGGFVDTEKAEKQLDEGLERVAESAEKVRDGFQRAFDPEIILQTARTIRDSVVEPLREANEQRSIAEDLQRQMNDVILRERDLMVERAKMDRDMAQARENARNMEISAQERLNALQEVRDVEVGQIEKELELERDRLRIMEAQAEQSDNREQDEQELAEQRAAIFKLEEEHAKRMMTFNRDELAVQRQIREAQVRRSRFIFEQNERQRELDIDREVKNLELRGRLIEAETMRINSMLSREERRREEREAQLQAEFLSQQFSQREAEQMASEQARIESEQRVFDANKRLAEMEVEMRAKNLKMIADLIGATNEAVFGDSKELAIAQSLINTYQAVTANLAQGGTRGFIMAATAFAQGMANVRRILSTNLGDKSTPSDSSSSVARPSFGLVDTGTNQEALASGMASMFGGGQPTIEPTIVLEGEFDPEVLSIKVRTGNDAISGRTVGAGL